MTTQLPPGISPDGWIHEGFPYPDDFLEKIEDIAAPCTDSHPEGLRRCHVQPGDIDKIRKCTCYEPDTDPDFPDESIACSHHHSLGERGLCMMHLNVEEYLQQYPPCSQFNIFQQHALDTYNEGHFSYIKTQAELASCGNSLLRSILKELSDVEGCDSTEEAIRRLTQIKRHAHSLAATFSRHRLTLEQRQKEQAGT